MTRWRVERGECIEVMRGMPDDSIDSICTDPPYNLSDSGKRDADCLRRILLDVGLPHDEKRDLQVVERGDLASPSGRTESSDDNSPTDGSGSKPTGRSRPDTTSTTETRTHSTTNSGTSNSSSDGGIRPTTAQSEQRRSSATDTGAARDAASGSQSPTMQPERQPRDSPTATTADANTSASGEHGTAHITTPTCAPIDSAETERFFYCAKASTGERNAGLDHLPLAETGKMEDDAYEWATDGKGNPRSGPTRARNVHPTVKPIDLMRWLVRLVTPPGGTVLDPFTGSGTTGVAAALEGFDFIGIEREPKYAAIAEARIAWWSRFPPGTGTAVALGAGLDRARSEGAGQLDIFAAFDDAA